MKALTAENVTEIIKDCLYRDGEDTSNAIITQGVVGKFGFNPARLAEHKADIGEMLHDLPDQFHADKGQDWSFLQACMTRNGVQWGEHRNIDELLCLGIATGQARILFPREVWNAFPGGMPYFVVGQNVGKKQEAKTV
jgi:hypothetical protein